MFLLRTLIALNLWYFIHTEDVDIFDQNSNDISTQSDSVFIKEKLVFTKNKSPYLVRHDLIIGEDAKLIIEAGATIKFQPQKGITVRGALIAQGNADNRITLTSTIEPNEGKRVALGNVRLTDESSVARGRLQLFHNGKWRSVCTNSHRWSNRTYETICRQLGFQGGNFFRWYDREMPVRSRLLFNSDPLCSGSDATILDCPMVGKQRLQLGRGVCEYHPDMGIECMGRYSRVPLPPYWRGIRFENARYGRVLRPDQRGSLYESRSLSTLAHVDILFAGIGRKGNAVGSVEIEGVPPNVVALNVSNGAWHGVSVRAAGSAPFQMRNTTIQWNRGHGLFVDTSYGLVHVSGSLIRRNGADGIRVLHAEELPGQFHNRSEYSDFCNTAVTSQQSFPLLLYYEEEEQQKQQNCHKLFTTAFGHVITLHVLYVHNEYNETASALLEVYDGAASAIVKRLAVFPLHNHTKPQSLTSTGNQMLVRLSSTTDRPNTLLFLKLTSAPEPHYHLRVSESTISENQGSGIVIHNLRSEVRVYRSSLVRNSGTAGLHVGSGVGDLVVEHSRISLNSGDGINITYTGGNRTVSNCSISSNGGYGAAVWLNDTQPTDLVSVNQSTLVQHSHIYKNLHTGLLHGNFCGDSYINITGNNFKNGLDDDLEVISCWRSADMGTTRLQIGTNHFIGSERISLKLRPAINVVGRIEANYFRQGKMGALLVSNRDILPHIRNMSCNLTVIQNYFMNNSGLFVAQLELSMYTLPGLQWLLFTRNFVKNNRISDPFAHISEPRTRVAAPLVIGSDNVYIYRNIIENPLSRFEIGSQCEDQSRILNCTYNWLGHHSDDRISERLFDRSVRYNLAKIAFVPFLLHNSNPLTNKIHTHQFHVPTFIRPESNEIGGEVEGEELLGGQYQEYIVSSDINIRPGGRLILQPNVVLKFRPAIGMLVSGRLEVLATNSREMVTMTLEEPVENVEVKKEEMADGMETAPLTNEELPPTFLQDVQERNIRLYGGANEREGFLQIKQDGRWGNVCNLDWNMRSASVVCNQLGYVLNPYDWLWNQSGVAFADPLGEWFIAHVQCDEFDVNLMRCRKDVFRRDFEHVCDTNQDAVGIRCYMPAWAGVRFAALASHTDDFKYVMVEKAGLLDRSTYTYTAAVQFDWFNQNVDGVKILHNIYNALQIVYTNAFRVGGAGSGNGPMIRNSIIAQNGGAGVVCSQLGFRITDTVIANNSGVGIERDPMIFALAQLQLIGWLLKRSEVEPTEEYAYYPFVMPTQPDDEMVALTQNDIKYVVSTNVADGKSRRKLYKFFCDPGWVIGLQLLNAPRGIDSNESVRIYDTIRISEQTQMFDLARNLSSFPRVSASYGIIVEYESNGYSGGETVLILTTFRSSMRNGRRDSEFMPTLLVTGTKIENNGGGVTVITYNGNRNQHEDIFLRTTNESLKLINCRITNNRGPVLRLYTPYRAQLRHTDLTELTIMMNDTLMADNEQGITQLSEDMRESHSLYHVTLQNVVFIRNDFGGLTLQLPFVWEYNENYTHSVYLDNTTWTSNRRFAFDIAGHFAVVNMTRSRFVNNECLRALMCLRGMEKQLLIEGNQFIDNRAMFVVEFSTNSQSETIGVSSAVFKFNQLRRNRNDKFTSFNDPSATLRWRGVQKVVCNRNLLTDNTFDYQLVAGVRTATIHNSLDLRENWWGTADEEQLEAHILDFSERNNFASAIYRPFLTSDSFNATLASQRITDKLTGSVRLQGLITSDMVLEKRWTPYMVMSDVTIMPGATLTIYPGVVLEFERDVGLLVLGRLSAIGDVGNEIIMRPIRPESLLKRVVSQRRSDANINLRLCVGDGNCTVRSEGFLEQFNDTTLQWVPLCASRFNLLNAQVVCRQLGFEGGTFAYERRVEFEHYNWLDRIVSWPVPRQCMGDEMDWLQCSTQWRSQPHYEETQFNRCFWDSHFIFVHCDAVEARDRTYNHWGGIRFANADFEPHQQDNEQHKEDVVLMHNRFSKRSILKYVNVIGAGRLHGHPSAAVLSVLRSPDMFYVNVTESASDGIVVISPTESMHLDRVFVERSVGFGVNALILGGEKRDVLQSSFMPVQYGYLPSNLFGMIDACDATKELWIRQRMLIYFSLGARPANCIKVFRSSNEIKPLGFRLLQFNFYNSDQWFRSPDSITLYDGDIYNITSNVIEVLTANSNNAASIFKSTKPSLSIRLTADAGSEDYGFIAEVVTLPISNIGFNRDVQFNMTLSSVNNNDRGALHYASVGEVSPILSICKNQFRYNCRQFYGNITSCHEAIDINIQNTKNIFFEENLVEANIGGLSIRTNSTSTATALKGFVYNNLFVHNRRWPVLYVEGRNTSPFQEINIYRNYFTKNYAPYDSNIALRQVISNFSMNFVRRNMAWNNMQISGFEGDRLPIYQITSQNGFYYNSALNRDNRATIVAGTAGQLFNRNIFFDPDNDYEIASVNKTRSFIPVWGIRIDAKHNYWGMNHSLAVRSRIRDQSDDDWLMEVLFEPYLMTNITLLDNEKCPPGWNAVGDTCYIYIGSRMTFHEAKAFCESENASVPFLVGSSSHIELYNFLRKQNPSYLYSDVLWVQHLDHINDCTVYTYQSVVVHRCDEINPFVCEIDTKLTLNLHSLVDDVVTISVATSCLLALLFLAVIVACWWSKSKYRQTQRFERRNSIRQSLHSLKSMDLISSSYDTNSFRKDPTPMGTSEYPKVFSDESLESLAPSTYNYSSEADRQPLNNLRDTEKSWYAFKNQDFRVPADDTKISTATNKYPYGFRNTPFKGKVALTPSPYDSISRSNMNKQRPESSELSQDIDIRNMDTLPLSKDHTRSILDNSNDLIYANAIVKPNDASNVSIDNSLGVPDTSTFTNKVRNDADSITSCKTVPAFETHFDYSMPDVNNGMVGTKRSVSQPLETAM